MWQDEALRGLLPQIYEAAVEPELWPGVLEELAGAFGGSAGLLGVHDFHLQTGALYQTFGYDPDLVPAYATHHAGQNVWLRHERFYRRAGSIVTGQEVVPDDELIRTDFYREWLRPQDLHHRLCGVLQRHDASAVFLALMRPPRAEAFGPDERVRLALVIPHLQRALQLHRRVAVLRQGREVVQQALDRLPTGILFVDGECRPIARNHRANEILEAGDLVLRSGRLSACDEIATGELHRLIAACMDTANGDGTGAGGVLQICRAPTQPPLQVLVSPMRSMCDLLGHEESIAAVFVSDPGLPIDLEHERLCQLYGLSRVEAEFALRIVQGRSVEEASKSLRLAVNTGRAYLKRIFSKTGVHRQSDLVRLVLVGPAYPRTA